MAKKTKIPMFSIQGWDIDHYKTTEAYVAAVDALYNQAIQEFATLATRTNIDPEKPFSFADYPGTQASVQKIVNDLATNMQAVIQNGSRKQWLYACQKSDKFIESILDTTKVSKARLKKMQDRNLDALDTFQKRKVGKDGLDLSQRVWKYVGQFKDQMELGIDVGIGEGRSAQQLARDVKQNLQDPDRLFRRVRDKGGVLRLSKAAKAYHPGQGMYRSSTKNAQRLTRSEINMAYKEADRLRWSNLDFVVGYEVRRSNRGFKCKVCERLKGRYPKWFVFKGWHPQCMCFAVPILQDPDEFDEQELDELKAALKGTEYKKYSSRNTVTDVPAEFKKWVEENQEKSKSWKSAPYFVRDNFEGGTLAGQLKIVKPILTQPKENSVVEPVVVPVKAVSPNMPSELDVEGIYTKGSGIEFKKEFFDLIDSKHPIKLYIEKNIDGSFYRPFDKTVHIADNARNQKSKWHRESVIYHEFGHGIDWQRGLRYSSTVKALMKKYQTVLNKKEQYSYWTRNYDYSKGKIVNERKTALYSKIGIVSHRLDMIYDKIKNMSNETFIKRGITKDDVIEQIAATQDTIKSINIKYGWGHKTSYFRQSGKKEAEFLAHCFENAFVGNSVFKKYLPGLYNEMVDYIRGLE